MCFYVPIKDLPGYECLVLVVVGRLIVEWRLEEVLVKYETS